MGKATAEVKASESGFAKLFEAMHESRIVALPKLPGFWRITRYKYPNVFSAVEVDPSDYEWHVLY